MVRDLRHTIFCLTHFSWDLYEKDRNSIKNVFFVFAKLFDFKAQNSFVRVVNAILALGTTPNFQMLKKVLLDLLTHPGTCFLF